MTVQHLSLSTLSQTQAAPGRLSDLVAQQASTLGFADTIFLVPHWRRFWFP